MKQTIEEQLSALLDGELPVEQEELLLRRLGHEPRHREMLARFSLIGESLRGSVVVSSPLELGNRVNRLIDEEASHGGRSTVHSGPGLRSGLLGGAIAATIAIIALLSLSRQGEIPVGSPVQELAAVRATSESADISYTVPAGGARQSVIAPARLTGYLVSHGEYTSGLSRQIMNSYVVSQAPHTPVWDASEDASDD